MSKSIKLLFASTVLAGSVLAANAEVKLGVEADATYGFARQKKEFEVVSTNITKSKSKMGTNLDMNLTAEERADNGNVYGGLVALETKTDKTTKQNNVNVKKAYVFVRNDNMGELQLGKGYSASRQMRVDPYNFTRGGGANLDDSFSDFIGTDLDVSYSATYKGDKFLLDHQHLSDISKDGARRANKITYFTPRMSGLQLGLSFTPDLENTGEMGYFAAKHNNAAVLKDVFNAGLHYKADMTNGMGLEAAVTMANGKTKKKDLNTVSDYANLRSWNAGAALTFRQFIASASYQHNGKSLQLKADPNQKGRAQIYGITYVNGLMGASCTHQITSNAKYKTHATTAEADVVLYKGVKGYVSGTAFNFKAPHAVTFAAGARTGKRINNKGHLIAVGLKANLN